MNDPLVKWRKQIDILDEQLLNLLTKRFVIIKKIGQYKKENHLSALDKKRWNQVLESNLNKAKSLNLSKDFVKKLLTLLHKYSLKIQKEI